MKECSGNVSQSHLPQSSALDENEVAKRTTLEMRTK